MREDETISSNINISMEAAIDAVRQGRNEQIKEFLKENYLQGHFSSQYNRELSPIKLEFLRRDLHQLLLAPVDLVHYSMLIKSIKESNNRAIADEHLILFQQEIETIFKKYLF